MEALQNKFNDKLKDFFVNISSQNSFSYIFRQARTLLKDISNFNLMKEFIQKAKLFPSPPFDSKTIDSLLKFIIHSRVSFMDLASLEKLKLKEAINQFKLVNFTNKLNFIVSDIRIWEFF